MITTEESEQGPEVVFWQKVASWSLPNNLKGKYAIVFWQKVASWSLPNNLKGKYAIGSTIEVSKLCDDFQQLSKDTHLTVEYLSNYKARPFMVIIGKKFVWHTSDFWKIAFDLFEKEMVCS